MLSHPRQLGGLLPRLGNIIYLCFYLFDYSHVDVTSFSFLGALHPTTYLLASFLWDASFQILPQVRFEAPGRMIANSMKQGPGVIPSSQDGHFRSTKA